MAILDQNHRARARYVAIIADGNGRWASARGLPVTAGHEAGADTLRARLHDAAELRIRQLTVYSFSTENWRRPPDEVEGLIKMLGHRIARETPGLHHQGIRMRFIGGRTAIPRQLVALIDASERLTANNETLDLFIALNYGGRAEIIDAASRFKGDTEQDFRECLYAPDMHDPELLIRTGGEQRLSNFLPWQTANAELVFRPELWPDFTRAALATSLDAFIARQRDSHRRAEQTLTAVPHPASRPRLPDIVPHITTH